MRPLGILTTSYPASPDDGAGSFVRGFARACARRGLDVEVLCPELPRSAPGSSDPGVRVRRLAYWRPRSAQFLSSLPGAPDALTASPLRWAPAAAYSARLTAEVLRRPRYRALVSHWLVPSALAGALTTKVGHLAIAHGSDVALLERLPFGARLARLLVRRGLSFAFVSADLCDRFEALLPRAERAPFRERSLVQPMGVDIDALVGADREEARARLGLRGPVALWLGRLVEVKRPALALEVARQVPDLTVLVAGDGPLAEPLHAQAAPFGDRVRFLGWVDPERRRELLAAADVLLITSTTLPDGRSEGAPVVAREALAAGLPVVSTCAGGLAELTALQAPVRLVSDGSLPELARALRAALDAPRPRADERERLARALDWQYVLPRLLGSLDAQGG